MHMIEFAKGVSAAALMLSLTACSPDPVLPAGTCANALTDDEQRAGWTLLFDGQSLAHQNEDGHRGLQLLLIQKE